MPAISVPYTYADWVVLFDKLQKREADAEVLQVMQQGRIEWQAGIAERFTRKLLDAVNSRLNGGIDKFQRDMRYANGHERGITQALLAMRKEISFVLQMVNLPAIPQADRKRYADFVVQQARKIQSSIEDSAKSDRSGKLAVIVKYNRVDKL